MSGTVGLDLHAGDRRRYEQVRILRRGNQSSAGSCVEAVAGGAGLDSKAGIADNSRKEKLREVPGKEI